MSDIKKKEHETKFETSSFLLASARNFTYHFFLFKTRDSGRLPRGAETKCCLYRSHYIVITMRQLWQMALFINGWQTNSLNGPLRLPTRA